MYACIYVFWSKNASEWNYVEVEDTYVHTYMYVYIHTYVLTYTYIIHTYLHTRVRAYEHTNRSYMQITLTAIHTYIHTPHTTPIYKHNAHALVF